MKFFTIWLELASYKVHVHDANTELADSKKFKQDFCPH